mgnify:FL=1|tara:strand:+ start:1492 stop:2124 length:633 start_codon:yes stop_codon:yes gene_type:complete
MTEFDKKGYIVVKKAITKSTARFLYNYLLLKREVTKFLEYNKYPHVCIDTYGGFETKKDMIPGTYSLYADIAMETLLLAIKPKVEKIIDCEVYPTYSYARVYKQGDVLKRHKDRFSCEVSITLLLGGNEWPIFVAKYKKINTKGVKVDLKQGDMLIYKGCEREHWREKFKGVNSAQVFLHYNKVTTEGAEENKYDRRPYVGIPQTYQKPK